MMKSKSFAIMLSVLGIFLVAGMTGRSAATPLDEHELGQVRGLNPGHFYNDTDCTYTSLGIGQNSANDCNGNINEPCIICNGSNFVGVSGIAKTPTVKKIGVKDCTQYKKQKGRCLSATKCGDLVDNGNCAGAPEVYIEQIPTFGP